jgi:hypothetical protein
VLRKHLKINIPVNEEAQDVVRQILGMLLLISPASFVTNAVILGAVSLNNASYRLKKKS